MHKSKLKQISLAVCLALMPIYGFAAGLGKLNVNSGLGEPLRAEIELLSLTPEELASLSATVAPEEAYAIQGIPRLSIHNNIKVELAKAADGSPVLKLNSLQPISDPYLDMLIQVDWSSGRLLREYTILLDPPEYKTAINEATAAPSSVINKPSVSDYTSSTENQAIADKPTTAKSKKVKSASNKAEPVQEVASINESAELTQVTTQRGDSLAAIARDVKPEGVSLDQMLVGLFEANKNAFVDDNMNRLKVGQILKVPSKDTLLATDAKQARQEVKLHSANWNVYRNSVATNVVPTDAAEQNQVKQSASGKIASAEDLAAAKKAGPQDVVKLSAGGKLTGKEGSANYDGKVLALQEEATAKEKALKEAQERTAALEAQIADMQKLLTLKNQAMSNAQKSAETQANATQLAEVKPQPAAPVTPPAEIKATPVKPVEPTSVTATPKSAPVAAAPVAKPVESKSTPTQAKKPAPVLSTLPEEEDLGLLDSILAGIDLMMLAAAGGVALLVAGWAYLRNKRRRDLDSFERGILTSGGLSANTVFGNTTGNASTSDTSFLTDFAQSADGSMIDTNDVDPIAEAEVYMAYGRDAQAEEILKDAIVKEPKRYELHLKLLEMYAARKDISAFEAIAGELYTTLGSDNPTWAKVAELGVTVEPDNPLYDLSRLPAQVAEVAVDDTVAQTLGSAIDKELDWEKELDLDKELAFTSDFSSNPTTSSINESGKNEAVAGDVITQFGSASGELTHEQSMGSSAPTSDEALNNELALFSGVSDTSAQELVMSPSAEMETPSNEAPEAVADNVLNFDFSELGKFSAESSATDSKIDEGAKPESEGVEFAAAFTLPEADMDNIAPVNETSNTSVDNAALDFNFEGLNQEQAPASTEVTPSMSFEAVDFNLTGAEQPEIALEQEAQVQTEALAMPDLTGISLDLDEASSQDNAQPAEIEFDLPAVEDTIEIAAPTEDVESVTANNFDYSSISLDLSDATDAMTTTEAVAPVLAQVEVAEDPDVDIKLDLVKVYIDMEDVEGARDLLDEVIKEGGPNQRQTAEQLLATLA